MKTFRVRTAQNRFACAFFCELNWIICYACRSMPSQRLMKWVSDGDWRALLLFSKRRTSRGRRQTQFCAADVQLIFFSASTMSLIAFNDEAGGTQLETFSGVNDASKWFTKCKNPRAEATPSRVFFFHFQLEAFCFRLCFLNGTSERVVNSDSLLCLCLLMAGQRSTLYKKKRQTERERREKATSTISRAALKVCRRLRSQIRNENLNCKSRNLSIPITKLKCTLGVFAIIVCESLHYKSFFSFPLSVCFHYSLHLLAHFSFYHQKLAINVRARILWKKIEFN